MPSDDTQHGTGTLEWTRVIRSVRFEKIVPGTKAGTFVKSTTVKAVALALASYANVKTGRKVHPGIARLAADCEVGYNVASRVVAGLRDLGLIERTRRAVRRGARTDRLRADEYRLTLPEDLLERVTVPTPSDYLKIAARLARPHRTVAKTGLEPPNLTPTCAGLETAESGESNHVLAPQADESNPVLDRDLTPSRRAANLAMELAISTTSHSREDVSSDAAATRVGEAEPEDLNLDLDDGAHPPSLRVVTGGGKTTRAQPGLWPAAVPSPATVVRPVELQEPTPGELARAQLRAKLANRGRKPDAVDNDHSQLPAHPGTSKATRREAM